MTPDVIRLRPEVLELVREIASRPDSVLLRVTHDSSSRAWRDDRSWLMPTDSRLNRAEKHLLSVHREEVAHALRSGAWCQIATSSAGSTRVVRGFGVSRTIPVPTQRAVALAASDALRDSQRGPDVEGVVHALEALVDPVVSRWASPAVLCALAHRMVPTCNGRILAGIAHALADRHGPARSLFVDAARWAPTSELAAAAWQGLGGVEEQCDQWGRARSAHVRARRLEPGLLSAWVEELWTSVRLGDPAAALQSAHSIEQLVERDPNALVEHERRFSLVKNSIMRAWTRECDSTLNAVRDRAGSHVGRLLHALD